MKTKENTQELFFSTARRCINPAVPVSLAGYMKVRWWESVLDDIEVRVLALRQAEKNFLLIQCDLVTIPELVYAEVLKELSAFPFYSEENILMTATHSHTAPCPRFNGKPGDSAEYVAFLVQQIIAAVQDAVSGPFRKADVEGTLTADDRFSFNRRYWMKNGSVLTNPGRCNPEIVKPEGATDPEIPVLALRCEGKLEVLLAGIVNHTDTTGGTAVSADWPGWTRRTLEQEMDGAAPMMFPLIGASGNINHQDYLSYFHRSSPEEARRIGTGYAVTVRSALNALKQFPEPVLKTVFCPLEAKLAEVPESDLVTARRLMEQYADIPEETAFNISFSAENLAKCSPGALKYYAARLLEHAERKWRLRFRLTGFSIGPAVIASLPCEAFCEIGLDLRHRYFSDRLCLVVSHANGTGHREARGGYIPNYWNYDRGGYETSVRSSPFERTLSEKLRRAWMEIALTGQL